MGAKYLSQRDYSELERPKYIPKTREEGPGFFKGETVDVGRERAGKITKVPQLLWVRLTSARAGQ